MRERGRNGCARAPKRGVPRACCLIGGAVTVIMIVRTKLFKSWFPSGAHHRAARHTHPFPCTPNAFAQSSVWTLHTMDKCLACLKCFAKNDTALEQARKSYAQLHQKEAGPEPEPQLESCCQGS